MGRIAEREITTRKGARIVLRSAVPDDAPQLIGHLLHIRETAHEFNVTTLADPVPSVDDERTWAQSYLDAVGQVTIVAIDPRLDTSRPTGQIVGLLDFRNAPRPRVRHTGSLGISVHAEYRDKGVGREMLAALLDWARAHPFIEKVWLQVFAINARAIHLYSSMGFVEEFRRPREIKLEDGTYLDDIQMAQWVKR